MKILVADANLQSPILAVSLIILNDKHEVLLKKRKKEPDSGKWELIAGYVKPGETLVGAAQRLLNDKAQLSRFSSIEFTGKYYDKPGRHPGTTCIPFVFRVLLGGKPEVKGDLHWFSESDAKGLNMAFDNKTALFDSGFTKPAI
jgi:ADP-ribose pyrophosphatase YjhB (NUDIX family)